MKHGVRIVLLWLFIGGIANVLLTNALIGVIRPDNFPLTREELQIAETGFESSVPPSLPAPDRVVFTSNGFVTHYQMVHLLPDTTEWEEDYVINVMRYGFPMRALEARQIGFTRASTLEPPPFRSRGMIRLPLPPDWVYRWINVYPHVLAYWPVWPGILVNAAVYGLALAMAWRTLRRLRAARRIRRGRCASCAYELAGLEVCPECGRDVAAPAEHQHG